MNNKIRINKKLLAKIKEDNKKFKKIICLVSNTKKTIGLQFDSNGYLIKRSSLIYEEEDEANELCQSLKLTKFSYIENEEINSIPRLRLETEKKDTILKYLNKTEDKYVLKYLYYEYFKTECNNSLQMKNKLKKELEKEWNQKQNNLYKIVSILSQPTK